MSKLACRLTQIPFYRGFLSGKKGSGINVLAMLFVDFSNKNCFS